MAMTKNTIILLLFFLSGCATVNSVPADYQLSSESGKGVLLVSVTYHGSYSGYAMKFREVGGAEWSDVQVGSGTAFLPPSMLDWDIEEPGLRGNVFAVELPEGEYEFASWFVSSGAASIRPINSFSVRFNVSPGHAIYAGNFHFIRESGLGGMVTGVNVNYKNEFDRDVALIGKKYKLLDLSGVHNNAESTQEISRLGDGNSTTIMPIIFY